MGTFCELSEEMSTHMLMNSNGVVILIQSLVTVHVWACIEDWFGKSMDAHWVVTAMDFSGLLIESCDASLYSTAERELACATALVTVLICSYLAEKFTFVVFAVKDPHNTSKY